jgi:UDP-N-acetylmuramate--alanine ligase
VFDDYAHHPTEVAATLRAARRLAGGGRVVAVFQSHTYTRTKAFLPELAKALSLADAVLVPDIYAARESDTMGMSGEVLAARVGGEARYTGSLCHTAEVLLGCLQKGDLLVIMGAGDVGDIFAEFSAKGFTLKDK